MCYTNYSSKAGGSKESLVYGIYKVTRHISPNGEIGKHIALKMQRFGLSVRVRFGASSPFFTLLFECGATVDNGLLPHDIGAFEQQVSWTAFEAVGASSNLAAPIQSQ